MVSFFLNCFVINFVIDTKKAFLLSCDSDRGFLRQSLMTASMDPTTTTTTATTASHLLLSSRLLAHWSQYLLTYLSTVLIFKRNTSGSGRKAFDGICIYFRLLRHDQNKQKKHKSFVDVLKAIEDANHQAIITFICKIYSLQHLESVETPAR